MGVEFGTVEVESYRNFSHPALNRTSHCLIVGGTAFTLPFNETNFGASICSNNRIEHRRISKCRILFALKITPPTIWINNFGFLLTRAFLVALLSRSGRLQCPDLYFTRVHAHAATSSQAHKLTSSQAHNRYLVCHRDIVDFYLSGCLSRAGASQSALNSQMSLAKPQSELTWGLPSLQKRYVPPDRSLDHSS